LIFILISGEFGRNCKKNKSSQQVNSMAKRDIEEGRQTSKGNILIYFIKATWCFEGKMGNNLNRRWGRNR
jgi:hypothetical protein